MDHRSIDTGAIHAQEAAIHPMFEITGILAVLNKTLGRKLYGPYPSGHQRFHGNGQMHLLREVREALSGEHHQAGRERKARMGRDALRALHVLYPELPDGSD